jgi:hypothetical protein
MDAEHRQDDPRASPLGRRRSWGVSLASCGLRPHLVGLERYLLALGGYPPSPVWARTYRLGFFLCSPGNRVKESVQHVRSSYGRGTAWAGALARPASIQ